MQTKITTEATSESQTVLVRQSRRRILSVPMPVLKSKVELKPPTQYSRVEAIRLTYNVNRLAYHERRAESAKLRIDKVKGHREAAIQQHFEDMRQMLLDPNTTPELKKGLESYLLLYRELPKGYEQTQPTPGQEDKEVTITVSSTPVKDEVKEPAKDEPAKEKDEPKGKGKARSTATARRGVTKERRVKATAA